MESIRCGLKTRKRVRLGIALCLALACCGVQAQATIPEEYDVRAAIILNLARFVTWPAAKTADPRAPFVVGLLGHDEQTAALERDLAGRSVDGRKVAVRKLAPGDRAGDCFLIYVAAPEMKHYEDAEPEMERDGILTVSDNERFVFSGGVVGLPVNGDHIEIQVNLGRAQASGLTVSSRLLQLATVVGR